MTPSDILELKLNDSSLDLLNAAIASHNVKPELEEQHFGNTTEEETTVSHVKRGLDKDEQTTTAPKRAGRKPLDKSQTAESSLDPKQKRKAQNRAAQRAFRDRKEKHVAELQARIEELERLNATKDIELVKENEKLKEMLKKLQEENYALKGAQFTFEFPVQHEPTIKNDYTTSASSMSSNNSYSGEETNQQFSPLSNSHSHEDDSTSADTPTNNLFSTEPMQFGLIPSDNNLNFLSMTDNFDLGNGFSTSQNFPTSTSLNEVDLFNSKDDLFTNYRNPTTHDDFLFANEDLSSLFGGNNELFGFNNNQFAFDQSSFDLNPPPKCTEQKKQFMLDTLKKGQEQGKHIYQVHQEIKQHCPDFDIDSLCDDMKKKATCSIGNYPITDSAVDAFARCLDRA